MRLGGFFVAQSINELGPLCEKLDCYGLSTITATSNIVEFTSDDCAAFGNHARELNIIIGEIGVWGNLMTANKNIQSQRIEKVRCVLKKADAMGCFSVVTLVGTKDPSDVSLAPHPYMFTKECKAEFREIVL